MAINVSIDDSQLKGYSTHASEAVESSTKRYISDLIDEANRLEAGRGSKGGVPEVTAAMVHDARDSLSRGIGVARKKVGLKILKVAAALLSAAAGAMYSDVKLQSGGYLLAFIFVVALAILAVTLSTLLE